MENTSKESRRRRRRVRVQRAINIFDNQRDLATLGIMSVIALYLANYHFSLYFSIQSFVFHDHAWIGHVHHIGNEVHRVFDVNFVNKDMVLVLFFTLAMIECQKGIILSDGELRGKKAGAYLFGGLGGVLYPVGIYAILAFLLGPAKYASIINGAPVALATDIVASYAAGKLVFPDREGKQHPAVTALLIVAVGDDILGLFVIAYLSSGGMEPIWVLYSVVSSLVVGAIFNWIPRFCLTKEWHAAADFLVNRCGLIPYVLLGIWSWFCFHRSGIHPTLCMLPVLVVIPHKESYGGIGIYRKENDHLTRLELALKKVMPLVLGIFGFLSAGVVVSELGSATIVAFVSIISGKTFGIFTFTLISARVLRVDLGITKTELVLMGMCASVGFTVSIFMANIVDVTAKVRSQLIMAALLTTVMVPTPWLIKKLPMIRAYSRRASA